MINKRSDSKMKYAGKCFITKEKNSPRFLILHESIYLDIMERKYDTSALDERRAPKAVLIEVSHEN